jgi:hypothetical protein
VGQGVQLNVRDRRLDAACVAVPFVKKHV